MEKIRRSRMCVTPQIGAFEWAGWASRSIVVTRRRGRCAAPFGPGPGGVFGELPGAPRRPRGARPGVAGVGQGGGEGDAVAALRPAALPDREAGWGLPGRVGVDRGADALEDVDRDRESVLRGGGGAGGGAGDDAPAVVVARLG